LNKPPERSRARIAHAALLAAALIVALAAGRSRDVVLDLKVDPQAMPAAEAPTARPLEVLDDGAIELLHGFFPIETPPDAPSFRWMGARGVISLKHREPTMTLALTGWLPPDKLDPTTIEIELDRRPVARFQAPRGRFTRSFTVTDLAPLPDGHRVSIRASPTTTTEAPDPRELGLCIESITWRAATGDAG
jgi:hypothetical protein